MMMDFQWAPVSVIIHHAESFLACRGQGQQSISSLDDVEVALLQQPLAMGVAVQPNDTSLAESVPDQYTSSDRTGAVFVHSHVLMK